MTVPRWNLKGELLGACSCDWGCPCNFDARPTQGFCDGGYVLAVDEGSFGDVSLDGTVHALVAHAPGAVHEGNLTSVLLIDQAVTAAQREAIETLWKSEESGMPFDVWGTLTTTWLPTIVAPFEVKLDGINSQVRVAGGLFERAISRVKNPVTGAEEILYLDKPTGFTSKYSELGMSLTERITLQGLSYDYSGKYAEHARFEYAGP